MQTKLEESRSVDAKNRERKFVRITLLAGAFFFLGFVSVITGFVLTILYAFIPDHPSLRSVGTFFIFISIPLLLLGSYLLDQSDK